MLPSRSIFLAIKLARCGNQMLRGGGLGAVAMYGETNAEVLPPPKEPPSL